MTDKRQAIIDAIKAIQEARKMYGHTPGELPPGSFPIEVDPQLDEPKHNTTNDLLQQDVQVEDPDNVLQQQKDEKQKRQSSQNGQKNNQPDNKHNDEPSEDELDEPSDDLNNESEDESSNNQGKESGKKQSDEPGEQGDGPKNEDESDESSDDLDPDYIAAWNEIMDRFDNDNVSEQQLAQIISAIKAGKITSI